MIRVIIVVIAYCVLPVLSHAACGGSSPSLTAVSCEESDIQDCIDGSSDGDTINVPSGSCTWTTAVDIDQGITLSGPSTTIDCNVAISAGDSDKECLSITNTTGSARVTGFTFTETHASYYNSPGIINISSTQNDYRIDNCTFTGMNSRVISPTSAADGLIDNNTFTNTGDVNSECAIRVYPSSSEAMTAWTTATSLGSADAVYIEGNTFTHSSDVVCALDIENGGKVVARYNELTNYYLASHGLEGTLGVLKYEIYENEISATLDASNDIAISLRGGTGVIYNNDISDSSTAWWQKITAMNYCGTENCQDVTGCHSEITGVEACDGYPCKNQVGRTYNQTLAPVYIWDNTYDSVSNNNLYLFEVDQSSANACVEGVDDYAKIDEALVEDRDFYEGTSHPNYTPYTYPHPLRQSGNWQTGSGFFTTN